MNSHPAPTCPVPLPHPHEELKDPEAAPATRRLHCRSYDACLEVADDLGWTGFTCSHCQAFEPLTDVEEYRDLRGIISLVAEIQAEKTDDDTQQGE
jgi:hypothetical protein